MSRWARLLAAALLAALPSSAVALEGLSAGDAAPPFTLADLGGRPHSLEDLREGPAVIVFWSTWSPRSREILEDMKRYHEELSARGLKVLAVNIDGERITGARRREIADYADGLALPFPVLLDEGLATFAAYGVMAHPSTVIVDGEGRVAYSLGGYPLSLREELRESILKALGLWEPPPPEPLPAVGYVPAGGALQYYNMGLSLMERGQRERAIEAFRKASERDPEFIEPGLMAARFSLSEGDTADAEALLRRVDAGSINRGDLRYLAGCLLMAKGRTEKAREVFTALRSSSPGEGWGEWGMGMALYAEGDHRGAADMMREASSLRPENLEAEAFLRRILTDSWRRGEEPPLEEEFVSLFPSLEELRGRYRRMFRGGE